MKKSEIRVGGKYVARISGKLTTVMIVSESLYGGWNAVNTASNREVRIKTAAKLRKPVGISATATMADFWDQWHALKSSNPKTLLLFRFGDCFESLGEDASRVSSVLGVPITSRTNGFQEIDIAGFPCAILEASLAKLIAAGYRVAVCEQVDGPNPSRRTVVVPVSTDDDLLGNVRRKEEITNELTEQLERIVTPVT